jgi:Zn-dependent peptidase ImmA (M78 family)/DNA-binding XRE family transcriptional regulator
MTCIIRIALQSGKLGRQRSDGFNMSTLQEAFITAEMVRWARRRTGEAREGLAGRIHVSPEKLASWEAGEDLPTFRQAQHLAHALNIPFGFLYLSAPPLIQIPIPDLRTVTGHLPAEVSVEFSDLVNSVLLKQQWYRDYLEGEGRKPLSFVGRFDLHSSIEVVAEGIKKTIGINEELRRESVSWEDFLRKLIQKSEASGLLVLRSGIVESNTKRKLSVDEFRGFAISDDLAPLVFINVRDSKAAQIFTLIHELAHIWIGQSGISNPNFRKRSSQQKNKVEQFCNRVAAEVLIPKAEFLKNWRGQVSIEGNLRQLCVRFRVSTVAVLRQAFELDKISETQYLRHYQLEVQKWNEREAISAETNGGDFYATLRARNGSVFTEAIVEAALEGRILKRDAARLLNVKIPTLLKVSEKLFGEK